ncbi:MAG: hypothetical protein ABL949_08785 [Fimbriimonadaceae bacterium]
MSADFVRFIITLPSAMIIGLAVLFVVYKIIDGDIPPAFGVLTIGLLLVTLYFCVWPPHELVPPIAIVSILVIMAVFPFVENYLNQVELRRMDADRLEKVLSAWQQRPDNTAAALELARCLRDQGFDRHAINLAHTALNAASTKVDEVSNRSVRDIFRSEEVALKRWEQEVTDAPKSVRCPFCSHENNVSFVFCEKCKEPYLLGLVRQADPGRSIFARLLLSSAAVAFSLIGGASLGLRFGGTMLFLMLTLMIVAVGFIIFFVTRPARPAYLGRT